MWMVEELVDFFRRNGIPDKYYSIYKDKDETICLEKTKNEWLVYYSERGSKKELGWGKTESQALDILRLYVIEEYKMINRKL